MALNPRPSVARALVKGCFSGRVVRVRATRSATGGQWRARASDGAYSLHAHTCTAARHPTGTPPTTTPCRTQIGQGDMKLGPNGE